MSDFFACYATDPEHKTAIAHINIDKVEVGESWDKFRRIHGNSKRFAVFFVAQVLIGTNAAEHAIQFVFNGVERVFG